MQTELRDIVMPKMGESIMEATILKWLVKEGDVVQEGDSIVEIATDKVDSDIPSVYSGTIDQIIARENQIIPVGEVIAKIKTNAANNSQKTYSNAASNKEEKQTEPKQVESFSKGTGEGVTSTTHQGKQHSPLVRKMIKEAKLSADDIGTIIGTGLGGKLTKIDVQKYITNRSVTNDHFTNVATVDNGSNVIATHTLPGDEVIKMDRVRSIIAKKMLESKNTIPHVTSYAEANVTSLVGWMSKNKPLFLQKYGARLTYTSIFVEALAKTLKDYPMLNSLVIGDSIVKKQYINIGVAVALHDSNLIVPVIKHVNELSLEGIALKLEELVVKARSNSLSADDISGGTYTITNLGSFKNIMGTPIIMKPQVGIMGIGVIKKEPTVISTSSGDSIGIAHKLYLSHSFDHRVVDGAVGGGFVSKLAEHLEGFNSNRTI